MKLQYHRNRYDQDHYVGYDVGPCERDQELGDGDAVCKEGDMISGPDDREIGPTFEDSDP